MEQKSEVIYGKNPVTELLKSKAGVDTVFISESLNPSVQNYYTALAKECGAVVKRVHPMKLKSLCQSENHQGVAAYASTVEYVTIGQILEVAQKKGEAPFVVICDGIEDPHNLGAIMRSAYLMGAHGIIIPKRGGVSVTGIVHKTSAGASMHLPVCKVANIAQAVDENYTVNIPVVGEKSISVPVKAQNTTEIPITEGETVKTIVYGPRFIYNTARKGEKYGEVHIYLDDVMVGKTDLIYAQDVENMPTKRNIFNIWEILKSFRK